MAVALVTGVAGFIGAHLAARLLRDGVRVRGLDNLDAYYARELKEQNLTALRALPGCELQIADLNDVDLEALLEGADWVFHLAARPGVRRSWGEAFDGYVRANILGTQRLLEALHCRPGARLVFASSSSVYGEMSGQVGEDVPRRPISPYGVSKLAGEGLVQAYHETYAVPTVMLRYFTVYGPRQRPDMAFHRFVRALLEDREVEVFGDGGQSRDFTYVDDAVDATVRAAHRGRSGGVYNIGGGSPASVQEVLKILARLTGRRPRVRTLPAEPGDPRVTHADTRRARAELGFAPAMSLEGGLAQMVAWMDALLGARPAAGGEHG